MICQCYIVGGITICRHAVVLYTGIYSQGTHISIANCKMKYNHVVHLAMFLSAFFEKVSAHGYFGYVQTQCRVPGSIEKTEFIFSVTYNKIEYIRYNSTEDKAVGYTEFGEKWAEDYNKNKILLAQAEFGLDKCKGIAKFIVPNAGLTVKPEVIIRSAREAKGNEKAVLVCSAYDFFPKLIKLTWLRDDKEVTADMTSIEELADGDWYYQVHSHLEYFPKPGEKVSCVVEHASSHKPMIYDWDSSPSESERSKIILGAVGLLMGVFMAAGGLIYYKRKHTGFYRLPVCLLPIQPMNDTELQLQ
uniref:Si:busm1-228j01.4 n=2 Tax=Cyprinus carpio TaxID=7962 RepID=A0A8C2IV92_CYPCA